MKRKPAKWELLLIFERFRGYSTKELCKKLKPLGYKPATIYRYAQHWREADNAVRVMQKEL